jgi:[ribosomal protein S18]-alanine N-acetyltransferase
MRFRPYRPSDLATLFNIDQQCFPPGIAYSMEELTDFVHHRTSRTWVAEYEGGIAGFLVASRQPGRAGHIITIDVAETWRRKGIGRALMEITEKWARAAGIEILRLETAEDNLTAQRFYESVGYRKTTKVENYYGPGRDAWVMAKWLR